PTIAEPRTGHARTGERWSELSSGRLPSDETHERLARIEHPIAPPVTRRWRSGVHLSRTARDHGPRDVYVLGAAKEGACRTSFDHAEHELVMGVWGETLSS